MFKTLGMTALIATLVIATPAQAEVNIQRYTNLSNVNCEDSQTIADMEEIWKRMKINNTGESSVGVMGRVKVLKSETRRKGSGKLMCNVTVKLERSSMPRIRGIFILIVFPNGRWQVKFQPR